MPERLVDVEKQGSNVLHTFPITITAPAAEEDAFKEKALEAAGNAKLVPNEELESLNAKMHVSRGGQLTPYGDPHGGHCHINRFTGLYLPFGRGPF